MNTEQDDPTPQEDTLCDHCANQDECNEHHMMCVNFEPLGTEDKQNL